MDFCRAGCGGGDLFDLGARMWGTTADFPATQKQLASVLGVALANGNHHVGGAASKPKLSRTLRYEIRDLAGELRATHVRHEFDDGSKSMPWDPTGVKPTELPLYGINRTADSQDGDPIVITEEEKPRE